MPLTFLKYPAPERTQESFLLHCEPWIQNILLLFWSIYRTIDLRADKTGFQVTLGSNCPASQRPVRPQDTAYLQFKLLTRDDNTGVSEIWTLLSLNILSSEAQDQQPLQIPWTFVCFLVLAHVTFILCVPAAHPPALPVGITRRPPRIYTRASVPRLSAPPALSTHAVPPLPCWTAPWCPRHPRFKASQGTEVAPKCRGSLTSLVLGAVLPGGRQLPLDARLQVLLLLAQHLLRLPQPGQGLLRRGPPSALVGGRAAAPLEEPGDLAHLGGLSSARGSPLPPRLFRGSAPGGGAERGWVRLGAGSGAGLRTRWPKSGAPNSTAPGRGQPPRLMLSPACPWGEWRSWSWGGTARRRAAGSSVRAAGAGLGSAPPCWQGGERSGCGGPRVGAPSWGVPDAGSGPGFSWFWGCHKGSCCVLAPGVNACSGEIQPRDRFAAGQRVWEGCC